VQTKLQLAEQVTVQQTLNGSTGRQLATITSVLRVSGKGIAYLRVPRQLKQGRYRLTLTITDSYGRTLKLTRTVRVAK
jgi:hypothetical protein